PSNTASAFPAPLPSLHRAGRTPVMRWPLRVSFLPRRQHSLNREFRSRNLLGHTAPSVAGCRQAARKHGPIKWGMFKFGESRRCNALAHGGLGGFLALKFCSTLLKFRTDKPAHTQARPDGSLE